MMHDIMPFASDNGKCLLHQLPSYLQGMADLEAADRLKAARAAAGFDSAKLAAEALEVPVASYIQHENGTRGFKRGSAARYARRFRTTPEWLLFGRGKEPASNSEPSVPDIEQMIREAIEDVVTLETRLSDLPRIVAPVLHEQLERFRVDRAAFGQSDGETVRDKAARSPRATKRGETEESRSS